MKMKDNKSVKLDDFKNVDGTYDFDAYHEAQKENGEICRRCGKFLILEGVNSGICRSCERTDIDKGEVRHETFIRCPYCWELFCPENEECEEGEHKIDCPKCGKYFEYEVRVDYTFISPPVKEEDYKKESDNMKDKKEIEPNDSSDQWEYAKIPYTRRDERIYT